MFFAVTISLHRRAIEKEKRFFNPRLLPKVREPCKPCSVKARQLIGRPLLPPPTSQITLARMFDAMFTRPIEETRRDDDEVPESEDDWSSVSGESEAEAIGEDLEETKNVFDQQEKA